MLSVFKLNFSKSAFHLNDDYERLSDIDKEKIADMITWSFIEYVENNNYSILIIANPIEVKRYTSVLSDNSVHYKLLNISNDILKHSFNIEDLIDIETLKSIKYKKFIEDLDDWIYENLDIDIVLDRISDVGINNLSKVEKEFLNNYKI